MKAIAGLLCLLGLAALPGGEAVDKLKLSSGHEIPIVGLGTSSTRNLEEVDKAITNALNNGYRHIDTAFAYHNEEAIGKTLKKWFDQGGKREELFITSKLPAQGNRPESVEKYLKRSLKDLGLDYVDMYLVHTPFSEVEKKNTYEGEEKGGYNVLDVADHMGVWKEMEKQVKAGRAKSIGLSNFNQTQILHVYNNAEIKPSNLQVESHAYLHQKDLRKFCKDHNIVMTAYAPLGSQKNREQLHKGTKKMLPALFELPLVKELAQKYKKTPGQIILKHTIQDGLVVIPKSSDAKRQKDNISLFDFQLTNEEMQKLDQLDKGEIGRVFDFLAFYKDLDKHPQYPWALV